MDQMTESEKYAAREVTSEGIEVADSFQPAPEPDPEPEVALPAVIETIRKEHHDISIHMLDRVSAWLNQGDLTITSYAVQKKSWKNEEALELQIDPKTTLRIAIEVAP